MSSLNTIWLLTLRNYKLYIRDKTSVFFSFLSPLILLFLYLFFLADVQKNSLVSIFSNISGFTYNLKDLEVFVYNWLFANVISTSVITISLGVSGNIVTDKVNGIINDYAVTPVEHYKVVISYFLSIFIVSFCINLFMFFVGQLIVILLGGTFISFLLFIKFLGVLIISLISIIFLIMLVISFIKSNSAYSFLSVIIGTLGGFIIGAYIPINSLSKEVQFVSNMFPSSLAAALFRNIFMLPPLQQLISSIDEPIYSIVLENIKNGFSLNIYYYDHLISESFMYIINFASIIIFMGLCILRYRKKVG